jgi:hypothetical protein
MFKRAPATSNRSPLRRRLERATQFAALLFSVVLGTAIYQDVSKGAPSPKASAPSPTEPRSSNVGPSDPGPRAGGTAAAGANGPLPGNAPPTENKRSEQAPSTTGAIKPEPEAALLSPAPLDCERGSPTFWEFANVELIDSASGRASSLVTSCRVSAVSPVSCQNAVIVGVGVASSKGVNATESARALRRGINLASALQKDLRARCTTGVTVSAYVLNLGRYNDERDEPDQRKVIALMATGANDADKAATDAVVSFAKSDPKIARYPTCELYRLDDAGQPTPVPAQQHNCGEQTGRTVSQE